MATTRNSPKVWLLGKPDRDIVGSGLPTNGAVLRNFMYHHQEEGLTVVDSASMTIDAALVVWAKARIPTQRKDSAIRKLRKLFDQYNKLKDSRLLQSEPARMKEEQFKCDLDELFDISTKDALSVMNNEEDKAFLLMQREDTSSSSMCGIDKSLAQKESRKNLRIAQAAAK